MAPKKSTTKPATEPAAAPAATTLEGRIVCSLQSAGRIGKSTFDDLFLDWLTYAGVPWGALDFDSDHATLSSRYEGHVPMPDGEMGDVPLLDLRTPETLRNVLGQIIHGAQEKQNPAVMVLDFPANATDGLLADFERVSFFDALDAVNVRMTVPLFLMDDAAAGESAGKIIQAIGDRVDFVFVRNPARGESKGIESRRVIREMMERGVPVIDMPAVYAATMQAAVEKVEREAGRFLPLGKIAERMKDPLARMELEKFIWLVSGQMEQAESVLLPYGSLIGKYVDFDKYAKKVAATAPGRKMGRLD